MYDKTVTDSSKVLRGKIIPGSVLEAKKQEKLSTKLCCLKKCFDRRVKQLSPRSCLQKFSVNPSQMCRTGKPVEIYENEFESIEMKSFGSITKGFRIDSDRGDSIKTAIGLDVNIISFFFI